MLPSFIRRRYDTDEITGPHAYAPLGDDDSSKEFKSLVDEAEEDSPLEPEEKSFHNDAQRRDGLRRVMKALVFLIPSFLEPKPNDVKPLRPTAWLGNADHSYHSD
jgi:hypothetical protein